MDILKIIRNMKLLRTLMKKKLVSQDEMYDLRHDDKMVIDLSAPSEEEGAKKLSDDNETFDTGLQGVAPQKVVPSAAAGGTEVAEASPSME